MDTNTLSDLISQRHAALVQLLELSQGQVDAIESNRMTDLMNILSAKQKPIQRLFELTSKLRPALHDDPDARHWPDQSQRIRCKEQQQQCEAMHAKLLEIEAECEAVLQTNRTEMTSRLERLSSGTDATSGYSQAQSYAASGSRSQLDLSSD
jgi:hypothetical protein